MIPDAICGHDRVLLRWALLLAIEVDQGKTRIETRSSGGRWAPRPVVYQSVHDPAKLTAITAELLRERGVPDLSESEFADVLEVRVRAHGEQIMIARRLPNMHKIGGPLLEMPQARALTLTLLDAPDATAQDIERMIEEVAK